MASSRDLFANKRKSANLDPNSTFKRAARPQSHMILEEPFELFDTPLPSIPLPEILEFNGVIQILLVQLLNKYSLVVSGC
jgi:hypothetical protein